MSIQLVHCSDIHLDRNFAFSTSSRVLERKKDITTNFSRIIDFSLSNHPDLFLISGDVFDRVSPTNYTRIFLTDKIRQLSDAGIKVFIIGGNHDVPKIPTQTSLAIDTLQSAGLATVFSESREMQRKVINVHGEDICISGKSFNTQNIYENPLRDYRIHLDGKYNILILHGSLAGMNVLPSVPEYANQNAFTGDDLGAGLTYLALGHYHNHFERYYKGTHIANPGSIEKLTWGEENDVKGFIWAELGNSEPKTEFHELQTRPMESVSLELSKGMDHSIHDRILSFLVPMSDPDKLIRLELTGQVSQEQFNKLNWIELNKACRKIFFESFIEKTNIQVEGFGRIFLGKVDKPMEAFSRRIDALILSDPKKRELLLAVKELGIRSLAEES